MQRPTSWSTPTIVEHDLQSTPIHHVQQMHHLHQIQSIHPIQRPFQKLELKPEQIQQLAIKEPVIAIPFAVRQPTHLVLAEEEVPGDIQSEPMIEIEQTTEPITEQLNEQFLIKSNGRRARLQNVNYK